MGAERGRRGRGAEGGGRRPRAALVLGAVPLVPALTAQGRAVAPAHRFQTFYVPNGMDMRHWNPSYEGKLGDPMLLVGLD